VSAEHDHAHDHGGHGHAGHSHGVSADADLPKLVVALSLLVGFMLVEVVVGIVASSLALLSDAGHMLTDAAAIGFSIVAIRLAARPAKGVMTFGLKRVEILSAQVNGLTLLILAVIILVEAVRRLVSPPEVEGGLVLAVALLGVVINIVATWVLSRANRQSLNVEGAFRHVLTDLYAFIGTAIAGAVILITGWARADPIASILVAGLMLHSAYGLLVASGRVFLEAAPQGSDPEQIGQAMAGMPGVAEVHDLHVWEVTSGFPALSAHVMVKGGADCHGIRRELEAMLHARFAIDHTTLQVDHEGGELLTLEVADGLAPPATP
jgi:cobalt-zinc-cadmium efflux system protein